MSRTERIFALMCALLLLCGCARAGELIDSGEIVPETANYHTEEVVLGDYIEQASISCSQIYPLSYNAVYEGVTARFVEYTVAKGDYVEKGDVIAVLQANISTVSLDTMQLNLQRVQEAYEQGVKTRQEAIEQKQQQLSAATDVYSREQLRLELEKLKLQMEMYRYEQERTIADQQQAIDEFVADYESTQVLAPADGYISDLSYYREGEPIYNGTWVASLYSDEKMLMLLKNDQQKFRYNMPVTVETGTAKNRTTLTGRVVATDNLISPTERTQNVAYILLEGVTEETDVRNSKAICDTVVVRNVPLLSRSALTLETGNYYVNKLVDGRVEKRFVNSLIAGSGKTWIIQGLNQGDQIILD